MTKFLAVYDDQNGERQCFIYYRWDLFHEDTFSPDCNRVFLMDLSKLPGKTYAEKKNNLRDKAIEYSTNTSEIYPISWGEAAEIQDYFETYGRRYGLLREFKENAIC